jgi:hypothetical protein
MIRVSREREKRKGWTGMGYESDASMADDYEDILDDFDFDDEPISNDIRETDYDGDGI